MKIRVQARTVRTSTIATLERELPCRPRLGTAHRFRRELAGPKREAVEKIEKPILFPRRKASGEWNFSSRCDSMWPTAR